MSRFWHPFSALAATDRGRLVLRAGDGATVVDAEGREYFDATAALWYCAVGHGRAEIATAIGAQAEQLAAYSCFETFATDSTLELADAIAAKVPLDEPRVFFTSGGSDGVETAAKIARRHFILRGEPQRMTMIARAGAYHGTHTYGTSLGGIAANHDGWGVLVADVAHVPAFDAEALEQKIAELGAETVAGFFVEPVIGAGGVYPPSDTYLREAAAVCARHGVLLICDEVVTGVGRTGAWTASERYGVRPDLMILAKALTSGYQPLGAVVASDSVVAPFAEEGAPPFKHGYTYSGHATACAAGLANLAVIEREGLVDRAGALGDRLPALIGGLADLEAVTEVRTVGLTAGIQLDVAWLEERGASAAHVVAACRARGQLTRVLASGALHFSPAFVATEEQISRFAEAVFDSIAALEG